MKTTIRSLLALCGVIFSGAVFAQDHVLTYTKVARPVDAVVNFAGDPHTMVRIPVREMVSGGRYSIFYPAPTVVGLFTNAVVSTVHSSEAFVPNITIDSFPAQVQVIDGLTYVLSSDGIGGYDFLVTSGATVLVAIDLGDTIVSISNSLQVKDFVTGLPILTDVNIGPSANAYPYAQYGKYLDRPFLVNALDDWIDHIRVITQ
jgi:hypothetical protein